MSKLIHAKIDVTKIDKAKLFKGKKGTYLDLTIWVNDTPDKVGNDISIEQQTTKGENKIFLGGGRFYVKKEAESTVRPMTKEDIMSLPDDNENLPF